MPDHDVELRQEVINIAWQEWRYGARRVVRRSWGRHLLHRPLHLVAKAARSTLLAQYKMFTAIAVSLRALL
jgi:hypothetical protein